MSKDELPLYKKHIQFGNNAGEKLEYIVEFYKYLPSKYIGKTLEDEEMLKEIQEEKLRKLTYAPIKKMEL